MIMNAGELFNLIMGNKLLANLLRQKSKWIIMQNEKPSRYINITFDLFSAVQFIRQIKRPAPPVAI